MAILYGQYLLNMILLVNSGFTGSNMETTHPIWAEKNVSELF